MAKKGPVFKVIPEQIKISKDELVKLLEDAHEMGYKTGLQDQQAYDTEQEEDCEFIINEFFDICNNQIVILTEVRGRELQSIHLSLDTRSHGNLPTQEVSSPILSKLVLYCLISIKLINNGAQWKNY